MVIRAIGENNVGKVDREWKVGNIMTKQGGKERPH